MAAMGMLITAVALVASLVQLLGAPERRPASAAWPACAGFPAPAVDSWWPVWVSLLLQPTAATSRNAKGSLDIG